MTPEVDRFYRTLVREAPDAILYADAQGIITFWNKAAERVFAFSEAEAGGKSLGIIIPEKLRKRHWDGFAETIRTGKTRYGAGGCSCGSGDDLALECSAPIQSPLRPAPIVATQ